VSECTTLPARESDDYPRQPQMENKTNAPITPVRLLPGDSAPLGTGVINTVATRGGNESHSRGRGRPVRKDQSPSKKIKKNRGRETRAREVKDPSPCMAIHAWQSMYRHAAARGFSPAACRTPLEVWNHPRRFSYLTVEFLLETDSGYPRDAAFFCH